MPISANEFKAKLSVLKQLTKTAYVQRDLDKLKRDVEDAYDNMQISEAEYVALQIAIKESY